MKKYLIVIEKTGTGYSAYCPDLPGCVAAAKSKPGLVKSMRAAISLHLEGLREQGLHVPRPKTSSTYLEVKAA